MKILLPACLGSCLLLIGCNSFQLNEKPPLPGSWRLYDVRAANDHAPDFATAAAMQQAVKLGGIITFFSDSSYFQMNGAGSLYQGQWWPTKNDVIKTVDQFENTNTATISKEKGTAAGSFFALQIQDGDRLFLYRKSAEPLPREADDPFLAANNQWRFKPTRAEDSIALSNRLAGYFKHLALLLQATTERKMKVVSFEFSKGPVKIYNGGIGIYPYEDVPVEWKASYYNDNNALQAYGLFQNYLRTNDYKGAGVGNWMEDDFHILQAIYADFKKP